MLKSLLFMLLIGILPISCKTTGGNKSETWASPENRAATIEFIKKTVVQLFPDVPPESRALQEFATALQDASSKQAESAEFLLRGYQGQRSVDPDNTSTEIAGYIAEHFMAMTNYVFVVEKKVKIEDLRYLGFGESKTAAKN